MLAKNKMSMFQKFIKELQKASMPKHEPSRDQFIKKRNELAEKFYANANKTTDYGNTSSDKLSEILATAALAYVGLVSMVFNDPKKIGELTQWQQVWMPANLICFILSIIFGIWRYMENTRFYNRVAILNEQAAKDIMHTRNDAEMNAEYNCHSRELNAKKNRRSPMWPIVAQLLSFGIGCLCMMFYIIATFY